MRPPAAIAKLANVIAAPAVQLIAMGEKTTLEFAARLDDAKSGDRAVTWHATVAQYSAYAAYASLHGSELSTAFDHHRCVRADTAAPAIPTIVCAECTGKIRPRGDGFKAEIAKYPRGTSCLHNHAAGTELSFVARTPAVRDVLKVEGTGVRMADSYRAERYVRRHRYRW